MKLLYRFLCLIYAIQQWLRRRFTTSGIVVVCCAIAAIIMGLDTKQTTTYQILALLLSVLIISMLFSWRFRGRYTATRMLPKFATVGVKLRYRLVIENKTNKIQKGLSLIDNFVNPIPSYGEFKKMFATEDRQQRFNSLTVIYYHWLKLIARRQKATVKGVNLPTIQPRGKTEVKVEITPSHRGVVRLSGVTIARPDPFGLFNACQTVALPQSLLVLPQRYQLPPLKLPGSRRSQSGGVSLASSVGDSEEFVSLRDYRPGDPLRKIHWKSWAKTGKPVVREEQNEYFVRHALILDTFQSAEYSEILEAAVSVAASFACDFHTQESLLDLMFVGLEAYCFTSGRGLGSTERMLEILAGVSACRHKAFDSLTSLVMTRTSMLSGCICIFITWDDARKKLVNYLRGLNVPTLVLIVTDDADKIDNLEHLHWLQLGSIQEGLLKI